MIIAAVVVLVLGVVAFALWPRKPEPPLLPKPSDKCKRNYPDV